MSLLSKLLKGKKPSIDDVVDLFKEKKTPAAQSANPAEQARPKPISQQPQGEETPIGRSWGERMPNEPNQYNYPGSYLQYFEDIFQTEFAAYRVVRTNNPLTSRATSYSFYTGDSPVLVVELLSRFCDAYQLRKNCRKNGIPYLRFYYDYEGWWNARSYVVRRMREAIGG